MNTKEKHEGYTINRCVLLWKEKREEWKEERVVRVIVFNRGQPKEECMKEYIWFCVKCDVDNGGGRKDRLWDTKKTDEENIEVEVEWAMKNTVTEIYKEYKEGPLWIGKKEYKEGIGNCLVWRYYGWDQGEKGSVKETGYMFIGEEMCGF